MKHENIKELYLKYGRGLRRHCLDLTTYVHEADDLVQEVFTRILKREDIEEVNYACLRLIARNARIDDLREGKSRRKYEVALHDPALLENLGYHPRIELDIFRRQLQEAVRRLPVDERVAFELFAVEGATVKAVETTLEVTQKKARLLIDGALEHLRALLGINIPRSVLSRKRRRVAPDRAGDQDVVLETVNALRKLTRRDPVAEWQQRIRRLEEDLSRTDHPDNERHSWILARKRSECPSISAHTCVVNALDDWPAGTLTRNQAIDKLPLLQKLLSTDSRGAPDTIAEALLLTYIGQFGEARAKVAEFAVTAESARNRRDARTLFHWLDTLEPPLYPTNHRQMARLVEQKLSLEPALPPLSLARLFADLHEPELATQCLNELANTPPELRSHWYIVAGRVALLENRWNDCLQLLEQGNQLDSELMGLRACAYASAGDTRSANSAILATLRAIRRPWTFQSLYLAGKALFVLRRFRLAIPVLVASILDAQLLSTECSPPDDCDACSIQKGDLRAHTTATKGLGLLHLAQCQVPDREAAELLRRAAESLEATGLPELEQARRLLNAVGPVSFDEASIVGTSLDALIAALGVNVRTCARR